MKGFTLIELLVVIAIIGILASIVLVSTSDTRARARDLRRLSDLKQMQKALELYRNANGHYPYSCGGSTPSGGPYPWYSFTNTPYSTNQMCTSANGTTFNGKTFAEEMAPYIAKLSDPTSVSGFWGSYLYINTRDASSYCFSTSRAENLNNFPASMISPYLCGGWNQSTGQCTTLGTGSEIRNGVFIGAGSYYTSAGC